MSDVSYHPAASSRLARRGSTAYGPDPLRRVRESTRRPGDRPDRPIMGGRRRIRNTGARTWDAGDARDITHQDGEGAVRLEETP